MEARAVWENIRKTWRHSRVYRWVLTAALLYVLLRFGAQVYYLMEFFRIGPTQGYLAPPDLQLYLNASQHLLNRQDLYTLGPLTDTTVYHYAPSFALLFIPFLWMTPQVAAITHTLLHFPIYALLYIRWARIFRKTGLAQAEETLILALPLWLVFSAFWGELAWLNIYILMALLATLLIEAVLEERLAWSLLWLSILFQIKPQWAFAAALPLLLGRWRFFFKLMILTLVVYLGIVGVVLLVAGPSYGLEQYKNYFLFLVNLSDNFPWHEPGHAYMGYNHSIAQVIIYWLGATPATMRVVTGIKLLLLMPFSVIAWRCFRDTLRRIDRKVSPLLSLDLVFVLYLSAFLWLDMVWELTLGIAVFTYLWATAKSSMAKAGMGITFVFYALIDLWRLVSLLLFGSKVLSPNLDVLSDPALYFPVITVVVLTFYAILLGRLWKPARQEKVVARYETG